MYASTPPVGDLTGEQRALVGAVRDFASRECGAAEQRNAPTAHGRYPHSPSSTNGSPHSVGSASPSPSVGAGAAAG